MFTTRACTSGCFHLGHGASIETCEFEACIDADAGMQFLDILSPEIERTKPFILRVGCGWRCDISVNYFSLNLAASDLSGWPRLGSVGKF